jgi:hypothetical protein
MQESSRDSKLQESLGGLVFLKYSREGKEKILVQKAKFLKGLRGNKLSG